MSKERVKPHGMISNLKEKSNMQLLLLSRTSILTSSEVFSFQKWLRTKTKAKAMQMATRSLTITLPLIEIIQKYHPKGKQALQKSECSLNRSQLAKQQNKVINLNGPDPVWIGEVVGVALNEFEEGRGSRVVSSHAKLIYLFISSKTYFTVTIYCIMY